MKKGMTLQILAITALLMVSVFFTSCKKDEVATDPLVEQIQTILPQKFIDSLKLHGLVLNEGKTPPVINGIYSFDPINEYDNSHLFLVGGAAANAKIKIANQAATNASVFIKGWVGVGVTDTSAAQVIAGAGNDFTVYAQAKGGSPVYTYDYVMTGTYSTTGLTNLKFAFIMINNGGNAGAATTGTIRIFKDKDSNATTTTVFRQEEAAAAKTAGAAN